MAKRSRLTQRDKRKLAIEMGVEVQQRDSSYQRKAGGGYNLDKFQLTENQQKIEDSIYQYDATVVQGSAGVGKTSVAIRTALKLLKENNDYKTIIFVKNPTESGDDAIGFLTGDKDEKLEKHFEVMRGVFLDFMTKGMLECDEKNGNIRFDIPNYLQGATLSNCIVILDETQNMSPSTLKMLMERLGENAKLVVLGDRAQTYAVNSRKDGFSDFVGRITDVDDSGRYSVEPLFNYIELTSTDNKRSPLSKRVTEIYS
jgi:phosphate starvation-inducible PhoH-like protein